MNNKDSNTNNKATTEKGKNIISEQINKKMSYEDKRKKVKVN